MKVNEDLILTRQQVFGLTEKKQELQTVLALDEVIYSL